MTSARVKDSVGFSRIAPPRSPSVSVELSESGERLRADEALLLDAVVQILEAYHGGLVVCDGALNVLAATERARALLSACVPADAVTAPSLLPPLVLNALKAHRALVALHVR